MRFNSIRFKISVLYTAVLGLILVVYSSFLYLSLQYVLYDELDMELERKAKEIITAVNEYAGVSPPGPQRIVNSAQRTLSFSFEESAEEPLRSRDLLWQQKLDKFDLREDYIDIIDTHGKAIAVTANFSGNLYVFSAKDRRNLDDNRPVYRSIHFNKRSLRMACFPFVVDENRTYIVRIATSLKPVIHLLRLRLLHIITSIIVVLIFASFLGRVFAARILRPVKNITQTASKITHEDLSSRVKVEHVDEEMRYLANAFNEMISRLERSFRYIAEFSSQVSHELKTPLAIIRGECDLALRKDRPTEEYRRVIRVTLEEVQRMLKVTEDLLLLTKLDYRPEFFSFGKVPLNGFIRDIYEQARMLAEPRKVNVTLRMPDEEVTLNADEVHLRRLFFNLISNAIKFTPEGGSIAIGLAVTDGKAVISVSDTGIGITAEDIPRIFERFYRSSRTAQQGESGTGLGLSIAQSIAAIHNGTIEVRSTPSQGSTFTVFLPL